MILKNTVFLGQFALIFFAFAGVCWFAEPRIPEDGMWIALKLMAMLGKLGCACMGGIFLLMAALQYTGLHHGKKAKAGAIKQYFFFGGYLLMAAALITMFVTVSVNGSRTIMFAAILGAGPIGLLSVIISFFFSGADSQPEDKPDKNAQ